MAGKRRLHGNLRGFQIADFADHHDVGILTQDRAQAAREGHFDFRVHLRLADAVDVVLDRIFDRHDVVAAIVEAQQRRVQRRAFAGTGRTGDEQYSVRTFDCFAQDVECPLIHTELAQIEFAGLFVEQTQHDAFTVPCGNRRDAHIDGTPGNLQPDAAVLWQSFFGDVQTRHDLDARHDGIGDRFLRTQYFTQHAIDAEANDQTILERFDVDVAGAFFHRFGENGVDETDDRRVVLGFEQIFRFGQFVGERF